MKAIPNPHHIPGLESADQHVNIKPHWTVAQTWRSASGRVLPAGDLIALYRDQLRGVSLCSASFTVFADGEVWARVVTPGTVRR